MKFWQFVGLIINNCLFSLLIMIFESKELASKLEDKEEAFPLVKTDLQVEGDILAAFKWIEENLVGIDVLINVAGLQPESNTVGEDLTEHWREILEDNILSLIFHIREALKSMRAHDIESGHIMNISSILAHMSSPTPDYDALYSGSQRAVQAVSEGISFELAMSNSNTEINSICPYVVQTELFEIAGVEIPEGTRYLQPENIAGTVICWLLMSPITQTTNLQILPTGEKLEKTST